MAHPMRTLSFKVSVELDNALTALARRRGASRSALVREAIEALASDGRRSVTDFVDELAQSVDGPADLSTNPRHMRGYGK